MKEVKTMLAKENGRVGEPPVDIRFTIPLPPRTKKNHQRIRRSRKTGGALHWAVGVLHPI